jgi:hypothetical protein
LLHCGFHPGHFWMLENMCDPLIREADLRGRCVKTDVTVRADGSVTIKTRNRGESALRWLEFLKGRKHLEAVAREPRE